MWWWVLWIVVDFCGFWCVGASGFSVGAGVWVEVDFLI